MKSIFTKKTKGPSFEERLIALEQSLSDEREAKASLAKELEDTKRKSSQELANVNTELAVMREKQEI
jgi:hypothetical protein